METQVKSQEEVVSNGKDLLLRLQREKETTKIQERDAMHDKHSDSGYSKHSDDFDKGRG